MNRLRRSHLPPAQTRTASCAGLTSCCARCGASSQLPPCVVGFSSHVPDRPTAHRLHDRAFHSGF